MKCLQLSLLVLVGLMSPIWAHHGDGKMNLNEINNEITVKLLQTLTDDDNALFSPIILSNSLLLLTNSVSGSAKDELMKVLNLKDKDDLNHVNLDAKEVWAHRAHLLSNKAKTSTDKTLFDLLPKLLVQTDKELKDNFKNLAKDNYPIDVYKMAALNDDNQRSETKKINEWFSEKSTTGSIGRMLDDNELTSDIKLLSLNGAGFKGAWKGEPFAKKDTKEEDFNNADGKKVKIAFMCAHEKPFRMVTDEAEKIQAIEIPFTEHDDADGHKHKTKLVVVIPTGDNTVDKAVDSMDREKLEKLLDKLIDAERKKPEHFKIPKLNFEKEYELKEAMGELNVKGVFDQAVANFSEMIQGTDASNPKLFLSQLDHKAVVQWNEEADKVADTEAVPANKDASIAVDKPFVFFITDEPEKKKTKRDAEGRRNKPMVIFAGRVKTLSRDTTFSLDIGTST